MPGLSWLKRASIDAGGMHNLVAAVRREYPELTNEEIIASLSSWNAMARPEQRLGIGPWLVWLVLAGRGFGKTRVGAEAILDWVEQGWCGRVALVAPTAADSRDTMVEGESGIVACAWRRGTPVKYEPSKRRITFWNGAIGTLFSAEEPDRLRGPQHHAAWCDELAAWDDPQAAWDQLQFGLRLGDHPRSVVTTTPRPLPLIRALIADPHTHVTKGSTYDNADNLPPSFLGAIERAYKDTRLGRQEIYAEILDDNPGALWRQAMIDALRIGPARVPTDFMRGCVAIDPAVSSNENSDLTGIVWGGIAPCWALPKCEGAVHGFVMEDCSNIYTPAKWAGRVADVYHLHKLDRAIGEVNNGGDLVESNLRAHGDANISFKAVHASRGKEIRAEPCSSLYEQGKVHHVGTHAKLEDEMTQWNPQAGLRSPSRMDALVWLLTELMLDTPTPTFEPPTGRAPRRM